MRSRSAFRPGLAVVALTAGALAGPVPARAAPANCQAPPGTSGIDQYCETVPAAGGDRGTRGGGQGGHRLHNHVSRRTANALRSAGPAGQGVLRLPTDGGASGQGSGSRTGTGGKGGTGTGSSGHGAATASQGDQSTPASRSDNPLQAIRSAVSTGTSVGPLLVWIFVAFGVGMAGLAWLSYRRSTN